MKLCSISLCLLSAFIAGHADLSTFPLPKYLSVVENILW